MEIITITEAKAKLSSLADKVEAGEEVIITRMGKAPMKLVPCEVNAASKRIGFMQGQGEIIGDFKEWPEDIARALHIID